MNQNEAKLREQTRRLQRVAPRLSGQITAVDYDTDTGQQRMATVKARGSLVRVPLGPSSPLLGIGDVVRIEQSGSPAAAEYSIVEVTNGQRAATGIVQVLDSATIGSKSYDGGDTIIGKVGAGNVWVDATGRVAIRDGNTEKIVLDPTTGVASLESVKAGGGTITIGDSGIEAQITTELLWDGGGNNAYKLVDSSNPPTVIGSFSGYWGWAGPGNPIHYHAEVGAFADKDDETPTNLAYARLSARCGTGQLGYVEVAAGPSGTSATVDTDAVLLTGSITASTAIAASAYHSTTQSIGNDSLTVLALNSESFDTMTLHDNSTNNSRLTAPVAGVYQVNAEVQWAGNANGLRQATLLISGNNPGYNALMAGVGGYQTTTNIATLVQLAANNYVEIAVWQDSGGSLNVNACRLSMARIA